MHELNQLIEKFDRNLTQYKSTSYDEANVRVDFIDKFFTILGWDVSNENGYSENYREVVREAKVITLGKPKNPDYSFRIGGIRKFFVEAKKPSIDIKQAKSPAFQIRRYAYTANLPLSILTNFQEFAVYDTRIKPAEKDDASVGRIFYCRYGDYEKEWDYLKGTFSQDAILTGSFDKYVSDKKRQKGTSTVDKEFLKTIDKWRVELAKAIARNNASLQTYDINYAVQKLIDRIIFLRFAEDHNIEEYGSIKKFLETKEQIYSQLDTFFKRADAKYNSSLFKPEDFISHLVIPDKILHSIISELYYPKCPYEFSVMPIEILGSIYEKFLGKTIRLTASHQAKVEEKPEVRKAGGVYYTPQYIVDYIVENTVGKKLKGRIASDFDSAAKIAGMVEKKVNDVHYLRVLDPACGSGSFLVRAYDYLLRWYLDQYTKAKSVNKNLKEHRIYQINNDQDYQLSIRSKQDILTRHIYGVDIDRQAVEVTRLSLLLKLMEGESQQTSAGFLRFDQARLLPDLSQNIKCGNSLIGSDFYEGKNLSLFDTSEKMKVNAFDWDGPDGFPEIMKYKEVEQDWETYHLTWVTHGSRISEKMIKYGTVLKNPVSLSIKSRQIIADALAEKIKAEKYRVLACNVLADHVHCVLVCIKEDISNIVQNLKGFSAHTHNRLLQLSVVGDGEQVKLWAKGSHQQELKDEKHVHNVIEYVWYNHQKHDIAEIDNRKLKQSVVSYEQAYKPAEQAGGFDCVIGNPPYARIQSLQESQPNSVTAYKEKYKSASVGNFDIYVLFNERGYKLLQENGVLGFIQPHKFMHADFGVGIRNFVSQKNGLQKMVHFGAEQIFSDATTYTCLLFLAKGNCKNFHFVKINENPIHHLSTAKGFLLKQPAENSKWHFMEPAKEKILQKLYSQPKRLGDMVRKIFQGIPTGSDKIYVLEIIKNNKNLITCFSKALDKEIKIETDLIKPFLMGKDVKRYQEPQPKNVVIFPYQLREDGANLMSLEYIKKNFPRGWEYLMENKKALGERENGRFKSTWWQFSRPQNLNEFATTKLMTPEIASSPKMTFDSLGTMYHTTKVYSFSFIDNKNLKYYLGVLNSPVLWFFLSSTGYILRGGFYTFKTEYLKPFPIPNLDLSNPAQKSQHDQMVSLVDQMLDTQKNLHKATSPVTKKQYQQDTEILDKQIDQLVYQLYKLTPEEIKIVEGDG